jgi:hypothetical protein
LNRGRRRLASRTWSCINGGVLGRRVANRRNIYRRALNIWSAHGSRICAGVSLSRLEASTRWRERRAVRTNGGGGLLQLLPITWGRRRLRGGLRCEGWRLPFSRGRDSCGIWSSRWRCGIGERLPNATGRNCVALRILGLRNGRPVRFRLSDGGQGCGWPRQFPYLDRPDRTDRLRFNNGPSAIFGG